MLFEDIFIAATCILNFLHLNHSMLYIPENGDDNHIECIISFYNCHHGFYFKLLATIQQLS